MTDKQKQAIRILNNLNERCGDDVFNEEDYFLLMDFVVNEPQLTYIPFTQTPPQPIDPIYGKFGEVTCGQNKEE
jgi:hypothetical protein